MWREEQIEQFAYLIRSGEGKRRWVMKDYKFEDARDPTTAAAAADGNEDDRENDSDDDDDRRTSSARSNFILRILFLAVHRVGYCCIITIYNLSYICNKSAIPSASIGKLLGASKSKRSLDVSDGGVLYLFDSHLQSP
jgi:hypothetical protein